MVLTTIAGALAARWMGLEWNSAVALGAMISLSSTACVIRILVDNATIDSLWGRASVGILLLQDIAVVPLAILVLALSAEIILRPNRPNCSAGPWCSAG